jgi:Xaa-Pro aminopeptidase
LNPVDAVLVSNPANTIYLTGFRSLEPQEREVYALVTSDSDVACGDLVAVTSASAAPPSSASARWSGLKIPSNRLGE